ncbi:hypothetical protein DWW55_09330 [Paraprevotella clara]|nr:hypothetical protein DWW55_09330 [Paraprevotella clara]
MGRSGYFSLNLSANSVMRGRLDARRTLKSLVADLREALFLFQTGKFKQALKIHKPIYPTIFIQKQEICNALIIRSVTW